MKTIFKIALASVAMFALATTAHAEGDAKKGKKVFNKCKACHAVGDGAKNKVGPHLNNVIGRKAGSVEGFKYSKKLLAKAEEGLVWSEENIDKFVAKPKKFIPGTKMAFAGLKKEKQRVDLMAYLKTFTK